jgi:hypothetical protein
MAEYPWKRFWCPREGSFRSDTAGFLEDPLGEFGPFINPDAKPLEAIADATFLGLLGEAGSGKTQTLWAEFASGTGVKPGDLSRHFWLPEIGTGSDFDRAIFDSNWFREWSKGDARLHLFLDALDEVKDSYSQIALRLMNRLNDLPLQRLFVRLTCRTASWPATFDSELRERLEKAGVGPRPYDVQELLPLRRQDVETAAEKEGLNPSDFLRELVQKGLVPLAIKPMTLRFLVNSYKSKRSLPTSSLAAYKAGCHELAAEPRRDGLDRKLDVEERLAIAGRIAAITLLCNRQAVWMGPGSDRPVTDVAAGDLVGTELLSERRLQFSDSEIREVLGTGLFTSRGENRFGWSHQTFAEFLCAQYLVRRRLSTPQILNLIETPHDASGSVRPQLAGTASWLASMSEETRLRLLRGDPAVLLRSAPTTLGPAVLPALVAALLEKFEKAELLDREWEFHRLYRKLAHPGIADQLRSVVSEPRLGVLTKQEAITIARACGLSALSTFFADAALDKTSPLPLRATAAYAVADIGTAESKRMLLPLAAGVPEDLSDELKGAALDALWPGLIETDRVLPLLTRQKRRNHFGVYKRFFTRLAREASVTDIPVLLRWIAGLDQSYSGSFTYRDLVEEILMRAWANADSAEIMVELPGALRNAQRLGFESSGTDWTQPAERRRLLIDHLSSNFSTREELQKEWWWTLGIPTPDDFEWLLTKLDKVDDHRRPVWLELVERAFRFDDSNHANALLEHSMRSQHLRSDLAMYLASIDLDSETATRGRTARQKRKEWEKRRDTYRKDGRVEIEKLLNLVEQGRHDAWVPLVQALSIGPDGEGGFGFPTTDVVGTPGWSTVSLDTRNRILLAAGTFLKDFEPRPSEWIGTNRWPGDVAAGISALSLLHQADPARLSSLPAEIWAHWAPALLTMPFLGASENETAIALRRTAYLKTPNAVLAAYSLVIERGDSFTVERLDDIWDDRLENLSLAALHKAGLSDSMFEALLRRLFEHRSATAVQYAAEVLLAAMPLQAAPGERILSTSVMLMEQDSLRAWPLLWPILKSDDAFAHEFFVAAARSGRPDYSSSTGALAESQAAELYVRLCELFPHAKDGSVSGHVGPDDEGRMLRDAVLSGLQNRGTEAACDAIAWIETQLPEIAWMRWIRLEARQARRRSEPRWPVPADVLRLAADRSQRFVRDAADLQNVLIETLQDLERELQGTDSAAPDLWDGNRPKPEEYISNWVKRHLKQQLPKRGVVFSREAQIHLREKTDLQVDAVVEASETVSAEIVTVIVEVKGCWNRELLTAMKTQLADRYLSKNESRFGIYLAFWFECDAWDAKDQRRQRRPWKRSLDELRTFFAAQAASLSGSAIRSLVIDTRLPVPRRPRRSSTSRLGRSRASSSPGPPTAPRPSRRSGSGSPLP